MNNSGAILSNLADPDRLLDRRETAAMLTGAGFKISKQSLAKLACTSNDGPEYRIFCGRALYRAGTALEWAKARAGVPRRSSFEAVAA